MKILSEKPASTQAMALAVTMVLCGILVILIGSYAFMVQTQSLAVARSQSWNYAIVVAEAGIDEAMAHLNSGVSTNNLATNSWTSVGSGLYSKTNTLGNSYSVVTIMIAPAVTNAFPVIVATSYVPTPIRTATLSRTIQVATKASYSNGNGAAILVKSTIDLSGFNVTVNSFDSSNPSSSTNGIYDASKALANGNIITLSSASNAINIGDSKIYGSVETPPGGVVAYDTKNNAGYSVGDSNYVSSGTVGIQSGHQVETTSYNNSITDVTLPNVTWWPVNALSGQSAKLILNGTQMAFPYQFTTTGNYQINSDLGSSVYVAAPNVQLYLPGNIKMGSGTEIYIAPGASLAIYVGGSSASIGGQGVVNTTGLAQDFVLYGLPNCTSVGIQANASFTGVIDAPEAFVSVGGGGSSPYDMSGEIIAQSCKINGNYKVHYDENLGSTPTFSGYKAVFWTEL
jgi:hypothetical protein